MSETAERIEDDCFGPRSPEQIHPSHDLESIDDVGHCKVCLQAWIGEVMTPGLADPCTKVKPKLDPMTGHPVDLREHEGFGQGLQDAGPARQQTAWIDARPWIDVTDGEVPPHMLLEKTPPQNGHDIGKVFESFFKSLDSGERPTAACEFCGNDGTISQNPPYSEDDDGEDYDEQPESGIGERIITGQLVITRDLIEFGVVKD